jgi:murein tripeptide amidase MpaA
MMIHHFLLAAAIAAAPVRDAGMTTEFERSGGTRTGTYDEAIALCREFDRASRLVHFETFGTSGEGRALPVLIIDAAGHHDPERVRRSGNVVVMIQAGIHAGEIDGKDAGFMLLREMVIEGTRRDLLDHVTIVFIPILNVDGHERSGPFNRPNQNGPEEMGFRTNATNLNLNRDYLKADTPEIRAWLGLFNRWQPEIFVDCHVTDGADYQHVMTYAIETWQNADTEVGAWTRTRFIPAIEARMAGAGYPLAPYCDFRRWHDPRSGLNYWVAPPRFSTGYAAIRNRVALLIETHMLKDYATRVRGTHQMLIETLAIANQEHAILRETVARADRAVAQESFRREPLPLTWAVSYEESTMIDFLGFEYTVETSDVTGGPWFRYSATPANFRVPFFNHPRVASEARLPEAYAIPPQWVEAIQRVHDHGLASFTLRAALTLPVSTVRFHDVTWAATPYESHHPLEYAWEEIVEERTLEPGTVIVDLAQPGVRVAAHLFEPAGSDALVRWDYFDACFEQKEYIESYVIEGMAREMLAKDPALARDFEAMKQDSTFAGHPDRIRDWFYHRTPYYDTRQNVYPVGRILDRATVELLRRTSR